VGPRASLDELLHLIALRLMRADHERGEVGRLLGGFVLDLCNFTFHDIFLQHNCRDISLLRCTHFLLSVEPCFNSLCAVCARFVRAVAAPRGAVSGVRAGRLSPFTN
jgi:hypothetical protein